MKNNQTLLAAFVAVFAILGGAFFLMGDSSDSDAATEYDNSLTITAGENKTFPWTDVFIGYPYSVSGEDGVQSNLWLYTGPASGSSTMVSSTNVTVTSNSNAIMVSAKSNIPAGTYYLVLTYSESAGGETLEEYASKIVVSSGSGSGSGSESDLEFTNTAPTQGITGSTYTYSATTNIPATFSKSGTWPSWLSLNTSTGAVSGTLPSVTSFTTYTYKIHAVSNTLSTNTADQTNTIQVYPIAKITAANGNVISSTTGTALSKALSINVAATFAVSAGNGYNSLPSGVTLSSDGVISGTPTVAVSNYKVKIQASTTEGPAQSPTIVITFNILKKESTLQFTSEQPSGNVKVGDTVSFPLNTNVTGTTFILQEAPSWLAIDTDNYIRGTVPSSYTEQEDITFTILATSPQGQTAVQTPTLSIEPVLKFTSKPVADCIVIPHYTYREDGSLDADLVSDIKEGFSSVTSGRASSFTFIFVGKYADKVTWDFGDGTTAEGFTVDHTYSKAGTYSVTCTATNTYDDDNDDSTPKVTGTDSKTITVTVDAKPTDYLYTVALIFIGILILVLFLKLCFAKKTDSKRPSNRRR